MRYSLKNSKFKESMKGSFSGGGQHHILVAVDRRTGKSSKMHLWRHINRHHAHVDFFKKEKIRQAGMEETASVIETVFSCFYDDKMGNGAVIAEKLLAKRFQHPFQNRLLGSFAVVEKIRIFAQMIKKIGEGGPEIILGHQHLFQGVQLVCKFLHVMQRFPEPTVKVRPALFCGNIFKEYGTAQIKSKTARLSMIIH